MVTYREILEQKETDPVEFMQEPPAYENEEEENSFLTLL